MAVSAAVEFLLKSHGGDDCAVTNRTGRRRATARRQTGIPSGEKFAGRRLHDADENRAAIRHSVKSMRAAARFQVLKSVFFPIPVDRKHRQIWSKKFQNGQKFPCATVCRQADRYSAVPNLRSAEFSEHLLLAGFTLRNQTWLNF